MPFMEDSVRILSILIFVGVAALGITSYRSCNSDHDEDSVVRMNDNCPDTPNSDQRNSEYADDDQWGDACDLCPLVYNCTTRCSAGMNGTCWCVQLDQDEDGVGDECDNLPHIPNPNQRIFSDESGWGACDSS